MPKMKIKSTFLIILTILIISLVSMFFLREIPVLSPWKNWKVLSVDVNIPEKTVINELKKLSIDEFVTESSERLNSTTNYSPILPPDYNFYKNNLYRYFYDKNNNFRLYYLPKTTSNKTLKNLPFEYSIDIQSSFPYANTFISIVCVLLLLILINNKLRFGLSLIPIVLLNVLLPNFTSNVFTLFFLVIIYFWDKFIGRKNHLKALTKNYFVILSVIFCIISSVFSGLKGLILILLALLSFVCINIIISLISKFYIRKKENFDYVNIVSANKLNIFTKKTSLIFYSLSFFILISGLLYLLIPSFTNTTHKDTPLLIPTPLEYNGTRGFSLSSYTNLQSKKSPTEFPDLGDYVSQVWNATVFPYISLRDNKGYISNVTPETSIKTIDYFEENDKIVKQSKEIAIFSKDFIDESLEKIKSFDGPIIEKVLLDQDSFCATDFGNVKRNTPFTLILFIIAIIFSGTEIFIFFKFYKLGC